MFFYENRAAPPDAGFGVCQGRIVICGVAPTGNDGTTTWPMDQHHRVVSPVRYMDKFRNVGANCVRPAVKGYLLASFRRIPGRYVGGRPKVAPTNSILNDPSNSILSFYRQKNSTESSVLFSGFMFSGFIRRETFWTFCACTAGRLPRPRRRRLPLRPEPARACRCRLHPGRCRCGRCRFPGA